MEDESHWQAISEKSTKESSVREWKVNSTSQKYKLEAKPEAQQLITSQSLSRLLNKSIRMGKQPTSYS